VDRDVEPAKLGQKARGWVEAIHPGGRQLRDPEFSIRVELNLRWVEACDVGIEESPGGLRSGSRLVADDAGIAEIRQLIIELAAIGKTIVLASHLLAEVEKVCTHVAILQQGILIKSGDVLTALSQEEWLEVGSTEMGKLKEVLDRLPGLRRVSATGNYYQLYFNPPLPDAAWMNRYCFERGVTLNFLQVRKKSLESAFIELTNNVSN